MSDQMDALIKEINALAHKSKTQELSPEEKARQKELRAQYIKIFREGMRQQLEGIRVIDPDGNDVTPALRKKKVH